MDNEPKIVCTSILTRSRFRLLPIMFCKFATESRPLIDIRIWFPLNILKMNGQNLSKFCIHNDIDKMEIWIVNCRFSQICNRVTALDRHQNFVSAEYLENQWKEFDQFVYTH